MTQPKYEFDYIIVGSGAGGGPLAANLAKKGHAVLLLEAGGDPANNPNEPERLKYQVPAFHGLATEAPEMSWSYFVRHYSDDSKGAEDSKFEEGKGIWYPRASALGGCTAHNAMITVYPHNSDWDQLAEITGDPTWHSDSMRKYFERLEACTYVPQPEANEPDQTRHGFTGWLCTNKADPSLAVEDKQLLKQIATAALQTLLRMVRNPTALLSLLIAKVNLDAGEALELLKRLIHPSPDWSQIVERLVQKKADFLQSLFDPNDWEFVKHSMQGLCIVPLAVTKDGRRSSPRDFIRKSQEEMKNASKGKLDVWTDVLVTRVLFKKDDPSNTAIGVAYLQGKRLYKASTSPSDAKPTPQEVHAREVILCAGTFNTPQLLMLSGIGPKDHLNQVFQENKDFRVLVDLPGVGKNLQDRYEVGVISELAQPLAILGNAAFDPAKEDAELTKWKDGKGLYTTNGAVLGIILKSRRERPEPDLFLFGLPGYFKGYFQKYSKLLEQGKDHFTWAILKAHTGNRAGTVTLRSPDPCDTPAINFRYFGDKEEDDEAKEDLESLVEGIKFVWAMTRLNPSLKQTVLPGKSPVILDGSVSGRDEEIRDFIRKEAWGHHACGTCRMGSKTADRMVPPGDPEAVVDSDFRVYGTRNLRVVDASVFPRIPGFFIVSSIYMLSEKASDVIDQDAQNVPPSKEAGKKPQGGVEETKKEA